MSKRKESANWRFARIASLFIGAMPTCRLHYGFDPDEHRYVLKVEGTGLYIRDIRLLVDDRFYLKYGNTQDTIIIIDKNQE